MSFDFTKGGSAQSSESNGKSTYIFIHGPEASLDSWAKDMSGLILNAPVTRDAQILFLDWSRITGEGDGGTAPYYAASWIDSVADEASKALMEWNPNNTGTTIIGHSLGAVLGARLAARLDAGGITGQSGIKLIALDPSASVFDLRTDANGTTFGGFGGKGLCVVADDSIAGSESLMQTCREKYLIEYDDPANNSAFENTVDLTVQEYVNDIPVINLYGYYNNYIKNGDYKGLAMDMTKSGTCKVISFIPYIGPVIGISKLCETVLNKAELSAKQHNWVHETYREIIRHPFYDNLLSPARLNDMNGPHRIIPGVNTNGINGIIYTEKEQPSNIKYLKTERSGDNMFTLLGNGQSNILECDWDKSCMMYTSSGSDAVHQFTYGKNIYVADFDKKNDKIIYKDDMPSKWFNPLPINDKQWFNNGGAKAVPLDFYYGSQVVLEGVSKEEVEGWVKAALNNLKSEDQVATPISIK